MSCATVGNRLVLCLAHYPPFMGTDAAQALLQTMQQTLLGATGHASGTAAPDTTVDA